MTLSQSDDGVYPSSELFQHFDTKIKAYQLLQHACLTLYRLKKKTQTLGRQKGMRFYDQYHPYIRKNVYRHIVLQNFCRQCILTELPT